MKEPHLQYPYPSNYTIWLHLQRTRCQESHHLVKKNGIYHSMIIILRKDSTQWVSWIDEYNATFSSLPLLEVSVS